MDAITPDELAKAWGLKPRLRIWVGGNDRDARRLVEGLLAACETIRPPEGPIDVAFVTANDAAEALHFLEKLAVRAVGHTALWVVMREHSGQESRQGRVMGWPADAYQVGGWAATLRMRVVGGFVCIRAEPASPAKRG